VIGGQFGCTLIGPNLVTLQIVANCSAFCQQMLQQTKEEGINSDFELLLLTTST
jgi:hypothetical protein